MTTVTAAATEAFLRPGPRAPEYRQQCYSCRITTVRHTAKWARRVAAEAVSWSHRLDTSSSHQKKLRHVGLQPGFPLSDDSAWMEWAHLADEDVNRLMGVVSKINLVLSDACDPSSFTERLCSQSRGKN